MRNSLTGLAIDQEREEKLAEFRSLLEMFKYNPTPDNRERVIEAAKAVDRVRGGYKSAKYQTTISLTIEAELDSIVQGP